MAALPKKAWTGLVGGTSSDYASAVSTSIDGSVYIAGSTNGSIDGQHYGGDGFYDSFVTKYNGDGSKAWTKQSGSPSDDRALSLATSNDGSVYLAGTLDNDSYIIKLNSDGTRGWAKSLGGMRLGSFDAFSSTGCAFNTSNDGSIYIAGNTNNDSVLTKLNRDGDTSWTTKIPGGDHTTSTSICTSKDGSIFVVGNTDLSLDGQNNNGSTDTFLIKVNSDGSKAWTRLIGGVITDLALSVTTSSDGSIYVSGVTDSPIFDGVSNTAGPFSFSPFLTKFNSDGTKAWTRLVNDQPSSVICLSTSVYASSDGAIYLAVSSADTAGFPGDACIKIFKLNGDGTQALIWTIPLVSSIPASFSSDGSIFIAGSTYEKIFNGQINHGEGDAFLVKFILDSGGSSISPNINLDIGTTTTTANKTTTLASTISRLILTGTGNINGTGNTLNNYLTGNDGNNVLDGGAGNDIMAGGKGNDTYIVDSIYDSIIENANEGIDLVKSSLNWRLGANVENLTLTGAESLTGTGNKLNNVITGNSGDNILDGGAGNDTLIGGKGNDSYIVDSINDTVIEKPNEGTDTVQSYVNWTLGTNLENLTLTGTDALTGIGNTGKNTIIGNSGNNVLDGLGGTDVLTGGLGADTFRFSTRPNFGSSTADHIKDFKGSEGDVVQINKAAFGLASNASVSLATISSAADLTTSLGSASTFVYDSSSGNLYWNQNGTKTGFGSGGIFAVLDNHAALSASNISLV